MRLVKLHFTLHRRAEVLKSTPRSWRWNGDRVTRTAPTTDPHVPMSPPCFASPSVGQVRPGYCPGRPCATRIPTSHLSRWPRLPCFAPLPVIIRKSAACDPDTHLASKSVAPTPLLRVSVGRPCATRLLSRSAVCDPDTLRRLRLVPAPCVSVLLRVWQAAAHRLRCWVAVRWRFRLLCVLGWRWLCAAAGRGGSGRRSWMDTSGGLWRSGTGTAMGLRCRMWGRGSGLTLDSINTVPRGRSFLRRSEGPRGGVRPEDRGNPGCELTFHHTASKGIGPTTNGPRS